MNGEHSGTAQKKRVEGVRECSGRRGVPDAVAVCRDGAKERRGDGREDGSTSISAVAVDRGHEVKWRRK